MRGKFIVFGLLAGALFHRHRSLRWARFVWENGAHYAIFNALQAEKTFMKARHARRMADLDCSQRHSAWLLADVFPLPAGDGWFSEDRRAAASRSRPCRWSGR